MKSFNFDAIQSSGSGEFTPLPAGAYVARITDAVDFEQKEYVEVVFDIAEGPHAGFYSDDWGKAHPYAHHFFMSYKDSALGMLKGRLDAITASNPGFAADAAWNAGRLDMFVNRVVGINLQEEEYERSDGDTGTRLNVCQVVDAAKVREGKVKVRAKKTIGGSRRGGGQTVTAAPAQAYDGPVPFD